MNLKTNGIVNLHNIRTKLFSSLAMYADLGQKSSMVTVTIASKSQEALPSIRGEKSGNTFCFTFTNCGFVPWLFSGFMITPATSSTNCPILIPASWLITSYNFIFLIIYFNNNLFFDANSTICFLINLQVIPKIQLRNHDKSYILSFANQQFCKFISSNFAFSLNQ